MRRGPIGITALFALVLLFVGCTRTRIAPSPAPAPGETTAFPAASASGRGSGSGSPTSDVNVPALKQRLATREAEVARVRAEAESARQREQQARAELERVRSEPPPAPAAPAAASAEPAPVAPVPDLPVGKGGSPQLVAALRGRLITEQQRAARLEQDLERMRQETSSGPFENKMQNDLDAAHKDLDAAHKDLDSAHKEINDLKANLKAEREARQELATRYEQLQAQVRQASETRVESLTDLQREEIAALKLRQERALAEVQRDLLVSRQHEKELSDALAAGQGGQAVPLAATVSELRSENSALQGRLDDEHRSNAELSSKLQLAMRITDLIFKIQSGSRSDSGEPETAKTVSLSIEDRRPLSGAAGDAPAPAPIRRTEPVSSDPVIGPNGEWITTTDPE